MSHNYNVRKLEKKRRRCSAIIESECKIMPSYQIATKYVAILNAGLSTGLTEELVLETAGRFAKIHRLLMLPNKSYCFIECATVSDAENVMDNMNGKAEIGQNMGLVYMCYFETLPNTEDSNWLKPLPRGLIIIENFVSEEEENQILTAIKMEDVELEAALKHRKVKHFGYEFLYGLNTVDPNKPLNTKIPSELDHLWQRLNSIKENRSYSFEFCIPDQLTVNSYEPGQGIPPHVDTHSAFLETILSLSLESDVVMEFRRGLERRSVVLPRRSLLVMSDESRYDWTHGITPKMSDVIMTTSGNLTTQKRNKRTSLTFRKLRRSECNCNYPILCDTKLRKTKEEHEINATKAIQLEQLNVHNIYDKIAEHFSETRHSPWPQVVEFLKGFPKASIMLDVGCGNGKYLDCNPDLLNIGSDRSYGLLKVCSLQQYQIFRSDCLCLPIRSNSVDGCISIAVIHHLATKERRIKAIQELARVLRPFGRGLIYVWAKDQNANNKKSSYLRQNKSVNKNKTTEMSQRQDTHLLLEKKAKEAPVALPIHTNRTEFLQQDVLVPWKLKPTQAKQDNEEPSNSDKSTFLRYYHVFEEHELENLIKELPEIQLEKSYYDQGNHCVIFNKVKMSMQ